jgi:very-short-patch-repair endonuclease
MSQKLKYDWKLIQHDYDNGLTWQGIHDKYGVSTAAIHLAYRKNRFKTRTKSDAIKLRHKNFGAPKHSEETKQKISRIRIKYLQEHPDKVPYVINHSSKESYPEGIFRKALCSSGIIGWEQNYRNGIYEYDFAFPEQKLDIEIDGGTHLQEKVKKIDNRRDEWSRALGWTVVRFDAQRVKTDVVSCINEVKAILVPKQCEVNREREI